MKLESAGTECVTAEQVIPGEPDHAWCRCVDAETANSARPGLWIRLRINTQSRRDGGIADPGFLAVELPAAIDPFSARGDGGGVASYAGLGKQEGADALTRHQP